MNVWIVASLAAFGIPCAYAAAFLRSADLVALTILVASASASTVLLFVLLVHIGFRHRRDDLVEVVLDADPDVIARAVRGRVAGDLPDECWPVRVSVRSDGEVRVLLPDGDEGSSRTDPFPEVSDGRFPASRLAHLVAGEPCVHDLRPHFAPRARRGWIACHFAAASAGLAALSDPEALFDVQDDFNIFDVRLDRPSAHDLVRDLHAASDDA